jgi:hypothetical protein
LTLERFCSIYEHRTRPALDWADRHDTVHLGGRVGDGVARPRAE